MSLVNDYVLPFYFFETVQAYPHTFKTGDDYIEFSLVNNIGQNFFSLIFGGNKLSNSCAWKPLLKLIDPIA